MKFIRDILAEKKAAGKPVVSFEFFPPKTEEGDRNLLEKQIPLLLATRPDFCSVTYGAGGSTRDKTLMIVDRIQREHHLTALAHLTCVNHTREEVRALLEKMAAETKDEEQSAALTRAALFLTIPTQTEREGGSSVRGHAPSSAPISPPAAQ